jgi:hypothetical protein
VSIVQVLAFQKLEELAAASLTYPTPPPTCAGETYLIFSIFLKESLPVKYISSNSNEE